MTASSALWIAVGSSVAFGAALGLLVWWVLAVLTAEEPESQEAEEWRYDRTRIAALRRADVFFRVFQRPIQLLAKLNRSALPSRLPEIQREIQAAGLTGYWLAEEYLARMQWTALLLLPVYVYLGVAYLGSPGVVTGFLLSGGTVWFLRRRLSRTAQQRLLNIKRRMPFLLDLLTFLMEAGASFLQSLRQAVREFEGHAVAEEFGRVLADMNMGKARAEAFDNLRRRLNDEEISSIVGSIIQSEALGSPLSDIFRTQADVLRVKRSQRAETIAAEAGVNMLLPGVLVMAATVLIILGPFVLNYLYFGWEL